MGLRGLGAQDPQSEGVGFPQAGAHPQGGVGSGDAGRLSALRPWTEAAAWEGGAASSQRRADLSPRVWPPPEPLASAGSRSSPEVRLAQPPRQIPAPLVLSQSQTPSPCARRPRGEGQRRAAPPHDVSRALRQVLHLGVLTWRRAVTPSLGDWTSPG